jgi:hypothetical protein
LQASSMHRPDHLLVPPLSCHCLQVGLQQHTYTRVSVITHVFPVLTVP